MTFAQISGGVIVNIIELDDPSLIPLFSEGYDGFVQIDILPVIPQIGNNYNPAFQTFASSTAVGQGNVGDVQFNNGGVLGGSDNFTFDGNNVNVSNGVISAQDFIYSRRIAEDITISDGCSMINSNMQLSSTITLLGDAELILL